MYKLLYPIIFLALMAVGTNGQAQTLVSAPKVETSISIATARHERAIEEMDLTYRIQEIQGLWTFEVFGDGNLQFTQAEVLAPSHKQGLTTYAFAENAAKLAIVKVKAGTSVPSISDNEILPTKQE